MAAIVGGLAPRLSHPGRFGLLHTSRLFTYQWSTSVSAYTFGLYTGAEAPFDFVRLCYMNHTASPYTIGAASCQSSASKAADGHLPLDRAGAPRPMVPVTFNNAGAFGLPPSPSGSTAGLVVPAAADPAVPAWVASDWMNIPSVDPVDGGRHFYAVCRTYFSAGSPVLINDADGVAWNQVANPTAWDSVSGGRPALGMYRPGDVTAALGTIAGGGVSAGLTPHAVQFMTRSRGMTVLGIGDSLEQGLATTSWHNSAGFQAMRALSSPAFPVFYVNRGYSGQTSADAFQNGKAAIDNFTPDVALISIYSPNDNVTTQAQADAGWARAVALAQHCIEKRVVPVLKAQIPWNALSGAGDALRVALNARARAMEPGMLIADYDAVVSDGGTPARIKPAFNGDGVHLNDAGQAACASVLKPILAKLIAAARVA